jgi:hypothetical protein
MGGATKMFISHIFIEDRRGSDRVRYTTLIQESNFRTRKKSVEEMLRRRKSLEAESSKIKVVTIHLLQVKDQSLIYKADGY